MAQHHDFIKFIRSSDYCVYLVIHKMNREDASVTFSDLEIATIPEFPSFEGGVLRVGGSMARPGEWRLIGERSPFDYGDSLSSAPYIIVNANFHLHCVGTREDGFCKMDKACT